MIPALAAPPRAAEAQLAGTLRGLLLDQLPDPIFEASPGWGRTKDVKMVHVRRGRLVREVVKKNDGLWKKLRVTALSPRDNLVLDVRDVISPSPGLTTLTLFVAADVRFDASQEQWESGLKLYDTSLRARARVKVTLSCEASVRPDFSRGMPDLVVTVTVKRAEVGYDNLVVEHIAGVGGDAAKVLGSTAHGLMNQWKPSIERDLLATANRAVVKAGEHREVRIGFSQLLKAKK